MGARRGWGRAQRTLPAGPRHRADHRSYLSEEITLKLPSPCAACVAASFAAILAGCATESSRTLDVPPVAIASTPYAGRPVDIAIGRFDNRSNYLRGLFSDGVDRLGSQARTILVTALQQSGRFNVLDRDNLAEIRQESGFLNRALAVKGAGYVVTGDVTEFGRKDVGDRQLFGILGRGKTQVAYAKVSLNVVDSRTSEVVLSSQGAGEYSLSNREVIGFGGTAGYDSTLNGKVLDLAIGEAVNRLAERIDELAPAAAKGTP
jgi:curli biogenesis system outer membrane secretion channel CsgG